MAVSGLFCVDLLSCVRGLIRRSLSVFFRSVAGAVASQPVESEAASAADVGALGGSAISHASAPATGTSAPGLAKPSKDQSQSRDAFVREPALPEAHASSSQDAAPVFTLTSISDFISSLS